MVQTVPLGNVNLYKEEFEDTKEVIRIRKSKNRQNNGQKKTDKRTPKKDTAFILHLQISVVTALYLKLINRYIYLF